MRTQPRKREGALATLGRAIQVRRLGIRPDYWTTTVAPILTRL
jgi:hypothetical protein